MCGGCGEVMFIALLIFVIIYITEWNKGRINNDAMDKVMSLPSIIVMTLLGKMEWRDGKYKLIQQDKDKEQDNNS